MGTQIYPLQGQGVKNSCYTNLGGGQSCVHHENQRLVLWGPQPLPGKQCLRQRGNRAKLLHLPFLLCSGSAREHWYCCLEGSASLTLCMRQAGRGQARIWGKWRRAGAEQSAHHHPQECGRRRYSSSSRKELTCQLFIWGPFNGPADV